MPKLSGDISNEGMLDLSWAQTEEDLKGITSLTNIGMIRIPVNLMGVISAIPRTNVGFIYPIKPGLKKELFGQLRLTGDFLARGDPETTLVVVGQFIVIPPVESVGFKDISVIGQMILPRGSEAVISGKMSDLMGQIFYITWDKGTPRFFLGNESIGQEYLELLPEPAPWIIVGNINIEDNVTLELLRSSVPEIVLIGNITAPKSLVPLLQVLTTEKVGNITPR